MALEKSITKNILGKEMVFDNAYLKIDNLMGNKECIMLNISVYDSNKKNVIDTRSYTFIPSVDDDAPNFIKQGYGYLKSLPEYEDAVDC